MLLAHASTIPSHARRALPVRTGGYRFVDWASQTFLGVVAVVILALHQRAPASWPWIVAGHLTAMAILHWLVLTTHRGTQSVFLRYLRELYPILLYTPFFRETELINLVVGTPRLDPFFVHLEDHLFGTQPSVALMNAAPFPWLSELLYAAYFSYYLMIVGIGVWLLARNRAAFRHFIAVISFVFYSLYLVYMAVPVIGPRVLFRKTPEQDWFVATYPHLPTPAYPEVVQHGPFFHLMAFIYRHFQAMSAAFPSSHVAVAFATLWFSWRYVRPVRWIHLIAVLLLCLSTVYCHYHYAVDVPAGIIAAAVLVPLGNCCYRRFDPAPDFSADIP